MADLPPLATIADLAARVGETIPADDSQAAWFLDAASALIRSETGQTWVSDDNEIVATLPPEVKIICVEVAARLWRNPEGVIQETVGPFTQRLPDKFADGLFLTASEKSQLARYRGARLGLWSLKTTREDLFLDTTYLPVEGTTERMPFRDV
jgi:hypothetical protein